MNDGLTLAIILQILAIFVIIAEIIIPSGGILAIIATILFGSSLFMVFNDVGASTGFLFLAADIIIVPIMVIIGLKVLAKSPVTLKKQLSKKEGVTAQDTEMERYLEMEGIAVTDLRPAGTAIVNKKRIDVVTSGEYIERDSPIKVQSVTGNQVIVAKID